MDTFNTYNKIENAVKNLNRALLIEVRLYLEKHRHVTDENGRYLIVRNGFSRPRRVALLNGESVKIQTPRVNDRRKGFRFESKILPPFLRTFGKIEKILPISIYDNLSDDDLEMAIETFLNARDPIQVPQSDHFSNLTSST